MAEIRDFKAAHRLLIKFRSNDLMEGFVWRTTPQGFDYWESLYNDLYDQVEIPPERIEKAKENVRKLLGIIDPETEAEWE